VCGCVVNFQFFSFLFFHYVVSVENIVDRGGLELGPEARTLEARRAVFLAQLLALVNEREELVVQKSSLGRQKGDAKTRDDIQARLAAIADETAEYQALLTDVDFALKATAPAAAGATGAAAAATTSSQQQLQQQPEKPGKAFKMPDTKLFPSWNSAGRTEPLDLRRWLLGVARVCEGHHFQLQWPSSSHRSGGVHQDWAWRRKDAIKSEPYVGGLRRGLRCCFSAAVQP
jgi:hypothetical protein